MIVDESATTQPAASPSTNDAEPQAPIAPAQGGGSRAALAPNTATPYSASAAGGSDQVAEKGQSSALQAQAQAETATSTMSSDPPSSTAEATGSAAKSVLASPKNPTGPATTVSGAPAPAPGQVTQQQEQITPGAKNLKQGQPMQVETNLNQPTTKNDQPESTAQEVRGQATTEAVLPPRDNQPAQQSSAGSLVPAQSAPQESSSTSATHESQHGPGAKPVASKTLPRQPKRKIEEVDQPAVPPTANGKVQKTSTEESISFKVDDPTTSDMLSSVFRKALTLCSIDVSSDIGVKAVQPLWSIAQACNFSMLNGEEPSDSLTRFMVTVDSHMLSVDQFSKTTLEVMKILRDNTELLGRNIKKKIVIETELPQAQEEVQASSKKAKQVGPLVVSGEDGLTFIVVTNDGSRESLVWLINAKEIFARQLPKMPREYIVRLVMDRDHYSLICVKEGEVVGGVCFRPYMPQRFAEIAFLAVSGSHQVKGFGTLIMNHLKQYVKTIRLTHFLTYADNFAIGYFRKQGFTKVITMPRERWRAYIKDYDGGTLMECAINEYVDYLKIDAMIESQRKFLFEKIREASQADTVRPGLSLFREGQHVTNLVEQVPGIREAGWGVPVRNLSRVMSVAISKDPGSEDAPDLDPGLKLESGVDSDARLYYLNSKMLTMFRQIKAHSDAWPFLEPVPDTVTDYLEVVHDPIDLSLIRKRLDHGEYYDTSEKFYADLVKMCENCRIYNHPDTQYYKAANDLQRYIKDLFATFMLSTGEVEKAGANAEANAGAASEADVAASDPTKAAVNGETRPGALANEPTTPATLGSSTVLNKLGAPVSSEASVTTVSTLNPASEATTDKVDTAGTEQAVVPPPATSSDNGAII